VTELAQGVAQVADVDALSTGIAIASITEQTYTHLIIRPNVKCLEKETQKSRDILPLFEVYSNWFGRK